MTRSSPASATTHGKIRWVQRLGLLAIVVLIALEPRIERWFAGQNQNLSEHDGRVIVARPESASAPGKLTEIRKDVFQSSAGLIYRAGSEEGHRLRHVMQHAKDDPQKKIHGIFDGEGDQNTILAFIDEAWLRAMAGGTNVRRDRQNDRQIYTINLRRRVGRVGGEEGKRRNYPECRFVRIVLENGEEVITAYPTQSF